MESGETSEISPGILQGKLESEQRLTLVARLGDLPSRLMSMKAQKQ